MATKKSILWPQNVFNSLTENVGDTGDPGSIPGLGKIPWQRKQQPPPVFLPGKFLGQRSLAGYSPWDCKEPDMTEHAHTWSWTITFNHPLNWDPYFIRIFHPYAYNLSFFPPLERQYNIAILSHLVLKYFCFISKRRPQILFFFLSIYLG